MTRRTERKVEPDGSFIERESDKRSSIELSLNAKGGYQWSIKLYLDEENEITPTLERIKNIDASLRQRFGEGGQHE